MKRASVTKRLYTYKGKTEERWVVGWTDLKGKRREYWKCRNKRHAEAYATKIDRELADNIHVADRATITFGKACEAWLKDCTERHQSKNRDLAGQTLRTWTATARNHVIPRFGNVKLNKMRSVDIQNFVNEKAQTYEHNTVSQMQTVIFLVLKYAVYQEWLPRNPMQDKKVKVPGVRGKRGSPLVEDVRKLLDYYFGPQPSHARELNWSNRRVIVVLNVFCGLRLGECLGLQVSNIKFETNEIWVRNSLSPVDGLKAPKTEAGERDIPMNPIVVKVLRDHLELTGAKSGYVIRHLAGGKPDRCTIYLGFRKDMENAWLNKPDGKGKFSFHHLRHFAGSVWLWQGMRIQDVQRLLGHENLATTMGIYAHQLKEDEHAKQVLASLHAKFPGIAGSVPADVSAPPPVTIDAQPLPMTPPKAAPTLAIAAPTVAAVAAASPTTIELPEDAPAWLHELLRLIQGGWDLVAAAEHVGKSRTHILRCFHRAGLPLPSEVVRAVRDAKMKAAYEAGYRDREIASQTGVPFPTVKWWRAKHEAEIGIKPLISLKILSQERGRKTGKKREKQLNLL